MNKGTTMIATKTFSNLDYNNFEKHMEDRAFLKLQLVSFRVEDNKSLELVLSGHTDMLTTMTNFINCKANWV
jgi:hypothetical protein